jgi:NADH-quinone oxidoreductase subunit N
MSVTGSDLLGILAVGIVSVTALIAMLAGVFLKNSARLVMWLGLAGMAGGFAAAWGTYPSAGTAFGGMILAGGYASFFGMLILCAGILTFLLASDYLRKEGVEYPEFYVMVLFAVSGMMLMSAAADLIIVFLGLEVMSVSLYVLAGFMRRREKSIEASLKYFLLGAFATGFLLYGIALIYGTMGTTDLAGIASRFASAPPPSLFWVGAGLLLGGFAFKVGAVPFHMWVPDVYEGSPTPVSGIMSTGGKAAAFAAFLLVFVKSLGGGGAKVQTLLAIFAALSMVTGAVIAIAQKNLKRMLAYSSIAHAGYMLTGLAAANQLGESGVLYYLVAYTFMNIGTFGVISLIEQAEEKRLEFSDYAGLGLRQPFLGIVMSIFLFSLAGIPPLAGFFGKYYVFAAAVDAHMTWLAIVGVLASVVSVYYYLRVVVFMYFHEGPEGAEVISVPLLGSVALLLSAAGVVGIGVFPSSILSLTGWFF